MYVDVVVVLVLLLLVVVVKSNEKTCFAAFLREVGIWTIPSGFEVATALRYTTIYVGKKASVSEREEDNIIMSK